MGMAANKDLDRKQLHIVDPLPEPQTDQAWLDWLRLECKVTDKWGEESGFFKIAIDGETEEADKGGRFQNLELHISKTSWADGIKALYGPEGVAKLVALAKEFHPFWKDRASNKKR